MAAIDITISGVLFDKIARTTQNVVLIGEASYTGLGIGGGPIIPPESEKPPAQPGYPSFPIAGPGPFPPKPGYPPYPSHPIEIPEPPPDKPPIDPNTPPISWKVVWTPTEGWIVVGVPNVPHPAPSA